MSSLRVFTAVLACCFLPRLMMAEEVRIEIDPSHVENNVDEKIYGHFLEHVYHSVNGGLWGELVWNRTFEQNSLGTWAVANDCVIQEAVGTNQRLTFGSETWTDYEFTLEARKTGGSEGFLILFRCGTEEDFYWCNLGGWNNTAHQLERGRKDEGRWHGVGPRVPGSIERNRWYQVKVRCEGNRLQVWLDGKKLIDFSDPDGHRAGKAGVGTWATQARFRNLKVTALNGDLLLEGIPELPHQETTALHWQKFGSGAVEIVSRDAANGKSSQRLVSADEETGIEQAPFAVHSGEQYVGSLFARAEDASRLIVRLRSGDVVLASASVNVTGDGWAEYPFSLAVDQEALNATLQISIAGPGDVLVDQVSLMPASWKASGGYRPDLLDAVAQLRPPIIRWPGGCFASPYRWKDAIGPQAKRKIYPRDIWDDQDVNSYGVDEFVRMCKMIGAEPLIVVNIGTQTWNGDVDQNEFLQDVLDWIEYCNGPASSRWGAVRAENGHPEPYRVKYWEIDNETWHMGAGNYADAVTRFAPAMREADASIKLAACGSAGYGEQGNGLAWNRTIVERCAELFDYLSIHHYENPDRFQQGPLDYEAFFHETAALIRASDNPGLKIYVSEWNAQSTDWRTGLYCAGLLNAFERCGAFLEMGGPALFLRHTSATAWDNAFVNFDHRGWFPAPNYVVMKLWRDHCGPQRIEAKVIVADQSEANASLNFTAVKSADSKQCFFKVVNPANMSRTIALRLTGKQTVGGASMSLVAPDSTSAKNTMETPDAVRVTEGRVTTEGNTVRFTLPPLSAAVVTIVF